MQDTPDRKYAENVLKIILKIRNNSAANLKSTLKVLQEKQVGSKEQLLVRLAKKLATETGQNMARRAFKPEIYREIYEVDLFENFDKTNEVYLFYRSLVPDNLKTTEKLASIGHYSPIGSPGSATSKVIEINDENQNKEGGIKQQQQISAKNLTIDNIYSSLGKQRCALDRSVPEKERICYCDPMKVAMSSHIQTIQCRSCQHFSHHECQELNQKMRQSRIDQKLEFNCDHCQFMSLDPLAIPIATILSPFKISKLRNDIAKQQILGGCIGSCEQEFYLKPELFKMLKQNCESLRIQVRSIRLDGLGFEHCFPKYGFLQVNNAACQREFKIPDPPNHERKRKDQVLDITKICKAEKNFINIFQTQKNHKNNYTDHPGHIVGVFLIKLLQPQDMVKYVSTHKVEDPKMSLTRFKQFFNNIQCLDKDVEMIETQQTDRAILTLTDPMTMQPINIPVRGDVCSHLTCFDLATYVTMNSQNKRWQCPLCNKRCTSLKVDSLFKLLLDAREALNGQDSVDDIDYKVTVHQDLSITFTRNKGRTPYRTYYPHIVDDVCKSFQDSADEDKNKLEESKAQAASKFDEQKTKIITHSSSNEVGHQSILGKRKHGEDPIENYLVESNASSTVSKCQGQNADMSEPIEIE